MKNILLSLIVLTVFACSTKETEQHIAQPLQDSLAKEANIEADSSSGEIGEDFAETETFYVVIADTGKDYYPLRDKMLSLAKSADIKIDTLGRSFNKSKNKIVLPDDDEDEMYRGDYFPRRFPSETLSLEYLPLYTNPAGENTIALVRGIYESQQEADQAAEAIRSAVSAVFVAKAEIFTGCLH